jgi:nicotinic acid mononucleotide adenylyltransferase
MNQKKKIIIDGGSFSPPGLHHFLIAQAVAKYCEKLFVIPCGKREKKSSTSLVSLADRRQMAILGFRDIENVVFDFFDLIDGSFRPTWQLDEFYRNQNDQVEVWHVVGPDLIEGGARGESEIQREWGKGKQVWRKLNFFVIKPEGYQWDEKDLPPRHEVIEVKNLFGHSLHIREAIATGKPFEHLVLPMVANYIKKKHLYGYQV